MIRAVVVLSVLLAVSVEARLRDQLALFFEIGATESVVFLEQPAPGTLRITLRDTVTGATRAQTAPVPPVAAARLRGEAAASGVAVGVWEAEAAPGLAGPDAAAGGARPDYLSEPRELRRNRLNYVLTQTVFSYYLYSIALPVAFDADPERAAALQILSLPVAFGAHYFIARDKDFHDAHLWSTDYYASNSLIFSYGLPWVFMGFNEEAFRMGSVLAAASYPVSLWAGYKHGSTLLDDPGRVQLQSNIAFGSGLLAYLGFVNLWFDQEGEDYGRLALGGALGAGVAGHYLSYKYRPGEAVPGGVGAGIMTHTWLGLLTGVTSAILLDVESGRTALALTTFGGAAGFGHGLHFFKDKQDSYERARYNNYGALGGALVPLGVALLIGAEPNAQMLMMAVTAGAIGGYAITRSLTSGLVDSPRSVKHRGHPGFSFNPIPVPEAYARLDAEGETEWAMRMRVPGVLYRF